MNIENVEDVDTMSAVKFRMVDEVVGAVPMLGSLREWVMDKRRVDQFTNGM